MKALKAIALVWAILLMAFVVAIIIALGNGYHNAKQHPVCTNSACWSHGRFQ